MTQANICLFVCCFNLIIYELLCTKDIIIFFELIKGCKLSPIISTYGDTCIVINEQCALQNYFLFLACARHTPTSIFNISFYSFSLGPMILRQLLSVPKSGTLTSFFNTKSFAAWTLNSNLPHARQTFDLQADRITEYCKDQHSPIFRLPGLLKKNIHITKGWRQNWVNALCMHLISESFHSIICWVWSKEGFVVLMLLIVFGLLHVRVFLQCNII